MGLNIGRACRLSLGARRPPPALYVICASGGGGSGAQVRHSPVRAKLRAPRPTDLSVAGLVVLFQRQKGTHTHTQPQPQPLDHWQQRRQRTDRRANGNRQCFPGEPTVASQRAPGAPLSSPNSAAAQVSARARLNLGQQMRPASSQWPKAPHWRAPCAARLFDTGSRGWRPTESRARSFSGLNSISQKCTWPGG